MILCASILSNKSLMEEATKCLFRTSLRSTHSTRMCFTVSGHWQVPHSGKSSPVSRKECVKRVWPICNLFSNTESRRDRHVVCLQSPTVGLIAQDLFPAQQLHTSYHSSNIRLVIRGYTPEAGSFIRVTGKESADLAAAAASAFSLPMIPTWLGIQRRIMFLPFFCYNTVVLQKLLDEIWV